MKRNLLLGGCLAGILGGFIFLTMQVTELTKNQELIVGHLSDIQGVISTLPNLTPDDIAEIVDQQIHKKEQVRLQANRDAILSKYPLAKENGDLKEALYGKQGAEFTIVEFSDLDCPFCKKQHPEIRQLVERYPERVNVVFKHFPLGSIHPTSEARHLQSICVFRQSNQAFWAALDELYQSPSSTVDSLVEKLGLDKDAFQECLTDSEARKIIQADLALGQQLGISSTPTTYMVHNTSGKSLRIQGMNAMASFANAMDQLEKQASAPTTSQNEGSGVPGSAAPSASPQS